MVLVGERAATETKARKKRGRRSLPVVVIHHDARPDPPDHQLRPPRVDERPVVSTSFGARSCVYQWTSLAARSGVVVGVEEGDDPDALGPEGGRRGGFLFLPGLLHTQNVLFNRHKIVLTARR